MQKYLHSLQLVSGRPHFMILECKFFCIPKSGHSVNAEISAFRNTSTRLNICECRYWCIHRVGRFWNADFSAFRNTSTWLNICECIKFCIHKYSDKYSYFGMQIILHSRVGRFRNADFLHSHLCLICECRFFCIHIRV